MDHSQPLVEADAPEQRPHHQRPACLGVRAVEYGRLQAPGDVPQPLQRDPVADRVLRRRQIALDAVRERVHTRPRGQVGGEASGQLGVADRDARQQVRAQDDRLAARLRQQDQCTSARLAAGPRGRRDRDHRRQVGGDPVEAPGGEVVVGQAARVRDQQPHALRRVDRAAPSQPDHPVATLVAVDLEGGQDIPLGGVGVDLAEDGRRFEAPADLVDQARRHQAPVGDDQRPRDSEPCQLRRQEGSRTFPEQDAIGKREDRGDGPGFRAVFGPGRIVAHSAQIPPRFASRPSISADACQSPRALAFSTPVRRARVASSTSSDSRYDCPSCW